MCLEYYLEKHIIFQEFITYKVLYLDDGNELLIICIDNSNNMINNVV